MSLPGRSPVGVLIVDDQAPFRSAARMVVGLLDGFDVVGEADTGELGVRMASELHPDLVLMDVNLPGIDGLEATRLIRSDNGDSPVVFVLSTYEAGDYRERATNAGAAAFIAKADLDPVMLESLWDTSTS